MVEMERNSFAGFASSKKLVHIPPAAALKCSQFFGLRACRRQRSEDSDRQARRPPGGKKNKRQPSASSAVPEFTLLDQNFVGRCCRGSQLYGTTLLQSILPSKLGHGSLCPLTLLEINNEA